MPLAKGKKNIGPNIDKIKKEGIRGKPAKPGQALAVALNVAGVKKKKKGGRK